MQIAIVTFDGFNEIDSFVALNILNRVKLPEWKAQIVCPETTVTSMNGVIVHAQQSLSFLEEADAVLIGSGRLTRDLVQDNELTRRLRLHPSRQLIASQCSGALFLQRLGFLTGQPACTDRATRPYLQAQGVEVLGTRFHSRGNIATAGGCLASPCLAAWLICRLADRAEAVGALRYVAPVGSEQEFIDDVMSAIEAAEPDNTLHANR